jgi:hypothetical protein
MQITMQKAKISNRRWWHFLLPIAFFTAIAAAYFSPVLKGKVVQQGDTTKWEGMAQEVKKFYEETGESSCWTGSMFSGMPTYHIATYGVGPTNYVSYLARPLVVAFDARSMSIVMLSLITFYLLMLSLGANIWLAATGAIVFAFSSYNFIIIEAGHISKAYAIAYMPLVVAGLLMAYRGKVVLGAAVTAVALSLQIGNNHYQITYYLIFVVLGLVLSCFFYMLKQKQLKQFIATSCALALAAVFAVSVNAAGIYGNYEMGQESIRGKSELTAVGGDAEQPKSSGLDKDYAFAWSYGKAETFSLLIPNIHGGASGGELGTSSEVYKAYKARGAQLGKSIQSYTYWGEQPFTSGPVYLGAIVCFLFILGLLTYKRPIKWWLLGLTIFSILLSWGKNFEWFNDFLFYHLPLYSKFRTPSMVLVIAQFTVPLLALLTLKDLFDKKIPLPDLKKGLKYALGITGGICLIFAVMPGAFFDFRSSYDATYNMPDWYYTALLSDRENLLRSDALRSLVFIVLAAGVLYYFMKGTLKSGVYATVAIAALALVDLWQVDKRYLNDSNFVHPKSQKQQFAKSKADELILQDTSLSYRVLSLSNPFNDSFVSYYHKSIGGYNAAKLRRYQDLIERRITPEMHLFTSQASNARSAAEMEALMGSLTTLNMLNMRYIIHSSDAAPIRNDAAYGNAWFVEDFQIAENADAEMAMLSKIDPRKTAVIDKRFEQHLAAYQNPQPDENAAISMTKYKPNAVTYQSRSDADRLAVFSEVYYAHGWKAYVDGEPAPHFRASWILRGMVVPAGEHTVEFKFYPDGFYNAIKVARVSSAALLLALAGGVALALRRKKTASHLPAKK